MGVMWPVKWRELSVLGVTTLWYNFGKLLWSEETKKAKYGRNFIAEGL